MGVIPAGSTGDAFYGVWKAARAKFTQETTLEFIVDDAIRFINRTVLDGWDYHSDE